MERLALLRLSHLAIVAVVWAALVVLLPWIMMLGAVAYFRVRAMLSPATDHAIAFGGARWVSIPSMLMVIAVPLTVLLGAWLVARFVHRGVAP
jgi:hypothetical protein